MADYTDPYAPPHADLRRDRPDADAVPPETPRTPWRDLWLKPRATMRQILAGDTKRHVIALAALGGIADSFGPNSQFSTELDVPELLILACTLGPLIGVMSMYIGSAVLHWTGRWLGGEGSPADIRAAWAWPSVILGWVLVFAPVKLLLFDGAPVAVELGELDVGPGLWGLLGTMLAAEGTITLWASVASLFCLAEAQRYSLWYAFLNYLLLGLAFVLAFAAVAVMITILA